MSNLQRHTTQQQEGNDNVNLLQHQPQFSTRTGGSRRLPQHQFGLEHPSEHSILRRSPPSASSSSRSLPASLNTTRDFRSPLFVQQLQRRQPLVLDAAAAPSSSTATTDPTSSYSALTVGGSSAFLPLHHRGSGSGGLLRSIWKERGGQPVQNLQHSHQPHHSATTSIYAASSLSSSESVHSYASAPIYLAHPQPPFQEGAGAVPTACDVARDGSTARAGFMNKMGQNVPAWKRRFFVLEKPRANLYYFLSPRDASPRGCLDLEGAHACVLLSSPSEDDDDGEPESHDRKDDGAGSSNQRNGKPPARPDPASASWRFELYWPDSGKSVQLEARSREARDEWIEALQSNQFAAVDRLRQQAEHQASACASRIAELEREVHNYRLVERELQASQVEARNYKSQFEELDTALRKLQVQLRLTTQGDDDEATEQTKNGAVVSTPDKAESDGGPALEADSSPHASGSSVKVDANLVSSEQAPAVENEGAELAPNMRETSLLDASISDSRVFDDDALDAWNVPGAHFAGLYNACEQLRQAVHLSQVEASQAVADSSDAQLKLEAMEKRMEKAEKHLCKLWEENCGLRKVLKQKKRERQVLVREVKTLREEEASARISEQRKNSGLFAIDSSRSNNAEDDEERLLNELEAHVLSSIKLHEQLLGSPLKSPVLSTPVACGSLLDKADKTMSAKKDSAPPADSRSASVATTASGTSASVATSAGAADHAKSRPIASLLDDQSDSDDDMSTAPSISSVNVEAASVGEPRSVNSAIPQSNRNQKDEARIAVSAASSVASTPERPNPLLQLDESSVSTTGKQSHRSDVGSAPTTATRGEATSQLQCPFADVIPTRSNNSGGRSESVPRDEGELQVYHLTFYSRKIGLQFQKVPPPPEKTTGLLTAAVAADLRGTSNAGSNKTASELRRIAVISSYAKSENGGGLATTDDDVCQVAKPIDAVIVCGFSGFDDTGTNVRPKLGARLVAFDGVSVEAGKWTFDSIRKSIQARARPLTLSFRNDYLTTEQRAILTKAVSGVESSYRPPPQLTLQCPAVQRRPSFDPSVHSALSHESGAFVNRAATGTIPDDEMSGISARTSSSAGDHYRSPYPQSFSGARSASSSGARENRKRYTFRSFSDAGSSTSMISSVAPLVSSLLYRNNKDPFTPDYLLRKPEPVENTPQHQDFQSELL